MPHTRLRLALGVLIGHGNDCSSNNSYVLHSQIVDVLRLKYPKRHESKLPHGRYFVALFLCLSHGKKYLRILFGIVWSGYILGLVKKALIKK